MGKKVVLLIMACFMCASYSMSRKKDSGSSKFLITRSSLPYLYDKLLSYNIVCDSIIFYYSYRWSYPHTFFAKVCNEKPYRGVYYNRDSCTIDLDLRGGKMAILLDTTTINHIIINFRKWKTY